ncbi:MAG: molybdopterin-dependent oxidoreductase [Acidimicrobiales bacterium]
MSELPPETAPEPAAVRPGAGRPRGALAGALGAATSLAVLEVAALVDPDGSSVLESVGNRVIDSFAASLKDVAVAIFGTSDKAALQIGTVVIALAIGAWLGSWLDRRPALLVGGFAAFGAFGTWATAVDPQGSTLLALVASAVAGLAGATVALGLHGRWGRGAPDAAGPALDRRAVLVRGGVVLGVLAVGAAVARSVRDGIRESRLSQAVARRGPIPSAATVVSAPEGTLDQAGPDQVAGISPYLTPVDDFFRIDTALRVPVVDVDGWRLAVTGLVDRPLELSYDDLLARELVEVPVTIQCVSNEVGGDLVGTASWRGVRLADVLREAGVQDGAEQIVGESVDGFTAGFPVEAALDGRDALIAVAMDGRPLPPEHGFPVRLIVPGLYGYVSATKWLSEIRATTWDEAGYWIPRGWAREGPIKTMSRIDVPRSGADVEAGARPIAGVAWAPHRGIVRVEVRVDGGPWQEATLGPTASEDTWIQWWLRWDATPGDHELEVRATAADGDVQTDVEAPPAPDGATGHHTVRVAVR